MQVFMAKERVVEIPYKFCSIAADLFCVKKTHHTRGPNGVMCGLTNTVLEAVQLCLLGHDTLLCSVS